MDGPAGSGPGAVLVLVVELVIVLGISMAIAEFPKSSPRTKRTIGIENRSSVARGQDATRS